MTGDNKNNKKLEEKYKEVSQNIEQNHSVNKHGSFKDNNRIKLNATD